MLAGAHDQRDRREYIETNFGDGCFGGFGGVQDRGQHERYEHEREPLEHDERHDDGHHDGQFVAVADHVNVNVDVDVDGARGAAALSARGSGE